MYKALLGKRVKVNFNAPSKYVGYEGELVGISQDGTIARVNLDRDKKHGPTILYVNEIDLVGFSIENLIKSLPELAKILTVEELAKLVLGVTK